MSAGTVQAFAMIPQQAIMDKSLSHAELRMLAVIASFRNSRTGWTEACHDRLKAAMGLSARSNSGICPMLTSLTEKGYIERVSGSGRMKSRYRVIYDQPAPAADDVLSDEGDDDRETGHLPNRDTRPPNREAAHQAGREAANHADRPHTIFLEPEERTREESSLRSLTTNTKKSSGDTQKATRESQTAIDAWNLMAPEAGLAKIRTVPPSRAASLRARLSEVGIEGMLEAIARVGRSEHCRGHNNRGWKADFDFLLQQTSLVRTLEGRYDTRHAPDTRNGAAILLARMDSESPLLEGFLDG